MMRVAALALALLLAASGCSEQAEPDDAAAASDATTPAAPSPAAPVAPTGVETTAPGTSLRYGDEATVAWQLAPEGDVAVVDLRVDSVQEASRKDFVGWLQDESARESRPYYVRARAENVGDVDLGGESLPLYLLDDADRLGQAWAFEGAFKPCPSGPLPSSFAPGDTVDLCLVYLALDHARIETMSFVAAVGVPGVAWKGKVEKPRLRGARRRG
jgi:hypothetical protein